MKSETYRGDSTRGNIGEFSARSRRNLLRLALDLAEFYSPQFLLTLTYPGDWRSVAGDGGVCAAHLKAFRKRLVRYLERNGGTGDVSALWFREFQRRGAPHFHLLLWGDGLDGLDLEHARPWLSEAWADVVGHPDPDERAKHEQAGTQLAPMRTRSFAYAVTYATKPHQKHVPEGFTNPGRWWGRWNVEPPAPVTFSGNITLPDLYRVLGDLAATIRPHSARFADAMPLRVLDPVGRGWPSTVTVYGRDAASVLLAADLPLVVGSSP